eukprot:TRINITY_DN14965_c0_g1_i1.p1 TRINITY_DN14965_c0_g1~~TRINITY_DN14965_c0_g1_i1.p1  ORF type:complete len:118 (+),score=21.11 TRINITY_DN14965_c0_g1_i1:100-453(+)
MINKIYTRLSSVDRLRRKEPVDTGSSANLLMEDQIFASSLDIGKRCRFIHSNNSVHNVYSEESAEIWSSTWPKKNDSNSLLIAAPSDKENHANNIEHETMMMRERRLSFFQRICASD